MDLSVSPTAGAQPTPRPPKLLERLRVHLRTRHYSLRTEAAYVDWVRRFILFHDKRHPQDMGPAEVEAFLRCVLRGPRTRSARRGFAQPAFAHGRMMKAGSLAVTQKMNEIAGWPYSNLREQLSKTE